MNLTSPTQVEKKASNMEDSPVKKVQNFLSGNAEVGSVAKDYEKLLEGWAIGCKNVPCWYIW